MIFKSLVKASFPFSKSRTSDKFFNVTGLGLPGDGGLTMPFCHPLFPSDTYFEIDDLLDWLSQQAWLIAADTIV